MEPTVSPAAGDAPGRFLAARIAPQRRWLHLAGLASIGMALAAVALAAAVAMLVQQVLIEAKPIAASLLLLAAAAALARAGCAALRDLAGLKLAAAVTGALRADLLAQASRLGPAALAQAAPSGAWTSRSLEQVDAVHGYCARSLPAGFQAVAVPLLLLAAIAWADWLAALLLALAAPLIPLFMALIGIGSAQVHGEQQQEQQRLSAHYLDRLRGLDLLRRSGALEQARIEVFAAAERLRELTMRVLRVAFLSSAVIEFFSAVAIGLVAIYVGFGLLGFIAFGPADQLTLGSGLFVLLLAPELFLPLRALAASHHDRSAARAAAEALQPLLAPGPNPAPSGDSGPAKASPPDGLLLRVDAAFIQPDPQRPPMLDGVSLELGERECLAVAGPSGSGKSTLLALLAGFLDPATGQVLRADAARQCAWVGQRTPLLHGSLRDNLRMACSGPTRDPSLAAALAEAGLPVDDPALPQGLDTTIGEHNRGLSGGQAQRVALARALLSGRQLWLLDEPTSALDQDTARALLDRIFALARDRGLTLVIASHDPAVLARCDRVLWLDSGRIRDPDAHRVPA